eukprot:CAMPEP_0185798700 /NCGR_PEP_ID=MMETSP1174-20130828/162287_1 /TAXON_ID=35687 /ORGANISM="Dictyocha speculum, Strain CCMP1381" /LENGTH=248 /DNA_ID=CAMNT_0028494211 /DNA_START=1 /DNA_END=744 /DNA_ORIENTATION=-
MAAIEARADWLVKEGTPHNNGNKAWAFGKLGIDEPSFWDCLERGMGGPSLRKRISRKYVTPYGSGHLGGGEGQEKAAVVSVTREDSFTSKHLFQLAQVGVHASASGAEAKELAELKTRMGEAYQNEVLGSNERFKSNKQQITVELNFKHDREVALLRPEFAPFLAVDMADLENKLAIEFDGARQFSRGYSGERTERQGGKIVAKRQLLKNCGWPVVSLSLVRVPEIGEREPGEIEIMTQREARGRVEW